MSVEPMTPEELDAIEARANAAEAGPWTVVFKPDERPTVCTTAHFRVARCESWAHDHANVAFIAAARTDVPALVAEVRRLHAEVYRWRDAAAVNLRLAQGQSEKLDRARELVAATRHTDDCAASHHQHCGAECDYDDSTPEECARAFREGCECGLRGLCDALGVEVDRG